MTAQTTSSSRSPYDADCDLVLEMEEAGVGVEEILQYANGCLSEAEVRGLIRGLQHIAARDRAEGDGESPDREATSDRELAKELALL